MLYSIACAVVSSSYTGDHFIIYGMRSSETAVNQVRISDTGNHPRDAPTCAVVFRDAFFSQPNTVIRYGQPCKRCALLAPYMQLSVRNAVFSLPSKIISDTRNHQKDAENEIKFIRKQITCYSHSHTQPLVFDR